MSFSTNAPNEVQSYLDTSFWTQKRLIILKAIQTVKSENDVVPKSVHRKLCQTVKNLLAENGRQQTDLSVEDLKEINQVLSFLQDRHWYCRFLNIPQKQERPSTFPKNETELTAYHTLQILRKQAWAGITQTDLNDSKEQFHTFLITSAALEIACSTGLNLPQLIDALARLNSLNKAPCNLTVKVHPKANEKAVVALPVSSKALILLNAFYHAKFKAQDTHTPAFPDTRKDLLGLIKSAIKQDHELPVLTDGSHPKPIDIIQAAQYSLGFNGLEPIIQSRLGDDILPVSPPKTSDGFQFLCGNNSQKWPTILNRGEKHMAPASLDEHNTAVYELAPSLDSEKIEQYCWNEVCRIEMRHTLGTLRLLLRDQTGKYHNGVLDPDDVLASLTGLKDRCIEQFRAFALEEVHKDQIDELKDIISHLKSAFTNIDLAMRWAEYRLIDQGVMLDTFSKDLSNLFNQGFFQYSASFDLSHWDEEDAEILVSDYLLNRELKENTINKIIGTMASLCRFSREHLNLFTKIQFPLESEKSGLVLTRRNNIFGLQELDLITSEMLRDENDEKQLSCILDLAFYAGLRSGEVANLTLNSIVANDNEVTIYLPRFKTPSAYRSIPLHLLAPPEVCRRVQSVLEYRRIQYRKHNKKSATKVGLKQCYLFTKDGKVNECSSPEMIGAARNILKIKSGEGADLHLLRHSFASHIFLRWYCSRYHNLIPQLLEKNHWSFSDDGIGNLRFFLGESPDQAIPPTNVTSIIHLLKLMGHKTTTTFFRVYVHSFEVIADHAIQRCDHEEGKAILSGKAIAALVPKFGSRTSQSKLKDRSLKGIADMIRHQMAT